MITHNSKYFMRDNKNSLILNISTNKINNYSSTIEYVASSQSSSSISTRVGHNEDLYVLYCIKFTATQFTLILLYMVTQW